MSGKIIMKRKLDKTKQSLINNKVEIHASSVSSSTSTLNNEDKRSKKSDDFVIQFKKERTRCDTPSTEPSDSGLASTPVQVNQQNRDLLEAIQLKILELQNELEEFEQDVEGREEEYYYTHDPEHNRANNQTSEQDAEALGFAMCAQETMLFLQREGIPSDSILYTRLRNSLMGQSQSDRIFHL